MKNKCVMSSKSYYINKRTLYLIFVLIFVIANLYTFIDIKANECEEEDICITVDASKKKIKKAIFSHNGINEIYEYDEKENCIRLSVYKNNTLIQVHNCKYNNWGISSVECYDNNILTSKDTYEYNNDGKIINFSSYNYNNDDSHTISYEYDANGNEIKKIENYNYGANSGLKDNTNTIISSYNDKGLLIKREQVSNNQEIYITTYEYDTNGNLVKESHSDVLNITYEYDTNDNLIKKTNYDNNNTIISSISYEYNKNNNKTKETHYNTTNPDGNYFSLYEYDSLGNKIKIETHKNEEIDIEKFKITYDNDNNILKVVNYKNNNISYSTEYEYYNETPPEDIIVSTGTITTTGIYCASNYPSIQAGINIQKSNPNDITEYRWVACNNNNPEQWFEVSPWTRDNNWINWTPQESGGYVFVCYARVVGNEEESIIQSSFGTEYHKQIKGICQMPYTGPGGGYLIGIESYDNPNHSYKYEMLILDCNLYMQGKDAWVYTTGKCGAPENCLWTIWQPQYGYYWTLFRIYDSNDNLIDEACYGFENVY